MIASLRWDTVEPYDRGFEHRVGIASIALDPSDPANASIVDLDRAARDDGLVRFDTDVVLIAAPEPRGLLHVVANRGLVTTMPYGAGETVWPVASGRVDPADGWLLRRGLSVLWVGWQWDVIRGPGTVGVAAPEAVDERGQPIAGRVRLEFQPLSDVPRRRLADVTVAELATFETLPAADLHEADAVLTERDWFNGPRSLVARERWRFVDHEHVELDGGFRSRVHYELVYTTSRCPVAGVGLAAVRDVVAAVRADYTHVLALGISQSGRWLREFMLDTGNCDERGRRVFDGVHCHIAGGRRGEFNHRYAQPSTMNALGFTHLPPFSPSDGLLDRARMAGTAPRVFFTNTATEYWRGDASLAHPEPEGDEWRAYLYAGADHIGQVPGYIESLPVQLPGNRVETRWPMRAHLDALEAWVVDDMPPPASAVPRADDGTGVRRDTVLESFAQHREIVLPDVTTLLGMPPLDLGPTAAAGVGQFPASVTGLARPCLVSAVDDDGNEIAGVRLPEVAVPLGVSTGWNPEKPRPAAPVELWNLAGGNIPFPQTEILRRYGNRAAYRAAVQDVVDRLVRERHILAEDAATVLERAVARWDEATSGTGDRPGR